MGSAYYPFEQTRSSSSSSISIYVQLEGFPCSPDIPDQAEDVHSIARSPVLPKSAWRNGVAYVDGRFNYGNSTGDNLILPHSENIYSGDNLNWTKRVEGKITS